MATLGIVAPSFAAAPSESEKGEASSHALPAGDDAAGSCFRVKPHAQLMEEDTVAIVWMTTEKATGYVTWSQDGWVTEKKAWSVEDGLRDANSLVHRAVIEGFNPRLRLEYRVHSRVFADFGPYKVEYKRDEEVLSCSLDAVLSEDGAVTWAMFNDVHGRLAVYDKFISHLSDVSAFCVFNGDILSHIDDEQNVVQNVLGPLSRVTQEVGLPVWYLRGNHETRGAFAREMRNYLALKSSRYYGAATIGGARFVFIDTGEDKEDGHWAYSGLVDFDGYLARECEWLRKEVASSPWKNARARIVVRHIPPGTKKNRLARLAMLDGILAKAGVTLTMAAHWHNWRWHPPVPERPYPMIVGGGPKLGNPKLRKSATLVKCRLDASGLSVKLLDETGAVVINEKVALSNH